MPSYSYCLFKCGLEGQILKSSNSRKESLHISLSISGPKEYAPLSRYGVPSLLI